MRTLSRVLEASTQSASKVGLPVLEVTVRTLFDPQKVVKRRLKFCRKTPAPLEYQCLSSSVAPPGKDESHPIWEICAYYKVGRT